jgi:hypothetical protein
MELSRGLKMRLSLKSRLVAGMALLYLVGLFSMLLIVNTTVRSIIHNNVMNVAQKEALLYTNRIDSWFQAAAQKVSNLGIVLTSLPTRELMEDIIIDFVANSDVENVLLGFEDGTLIHGQGWFTTEEFLLKDRPWFYNAKNQLDGEVITTDPYPNFSSGTLTVSIAQRLHLESGEVEVISLNIHMNFIWIKFLSCLKMGKISRFFSRGKNNSISPLSKMSV